MSNVTRQNARENWKSIVENHNKSGLSQVDFCKQHNLSPAKLGYYRGIYNKQSEKNKAAGNFSLVKVNQLTAPAEIRLTLPNGFQCVFPCDMSKVRIREIVEMLLSC